MSFKYTDNGKTTKSVGGSTTPQKVGDTLFLYRRSMLYIPFQQNAYKVPETKREVRRRTTQNAEKVSETKKEHRRRTYCYVEVLLMKYMMPYTRSEATSRCS